MMLPIGRLHAELRNPFFARILSFCVDNRRIGGIFMVLLRDASSGGANLPQKRDFFRDLRLEISGGLAIISKLLRVRNQPS